MSPFLYSGLGRRQTIGANEQDAEPAGSGKAVFPIYGTVYAQHATPGPDCTSQLLHHRSPGAGEGSRSLLHGYAAFRPGCYSSNLHWPPADITGVA